MENLIFIIFVLIIIQLYLTYVGIEYLADRLHSIMIELKKIGR